MEKLGDRRRRGLNVEESSRVEPDLRSEPRKHRREGTGL